MRLYTKITLFMLIVGLLPLFIMSVISLTNVEDTIRCTANNALSALATEIGKEVQRTVNDGYQNILLLAQNPVITSVTVSREKQHEELTKMQKTHLIFKDITLLDTKGRIKASVFFSFRGSWEHTRWFQSALEGNNVLSDVHGVVYPTEFVMTAAVPIKDNIGNVKGVLVGQLDMERIWKITKNVSVGDDGEVLLVDHNGIVIAAPDSDKLLEPAEYDIIREAAINKKKGVATVSHKKGSSVAVYVPMLEEDSDTNALGWTVVVLRPQNEAYAPVYRARYGLLVATMACFLVVSVLSPWMSGQVSSRVSKLVRVTRRIGEGDFSEQVEDLGKDEIGELGKAFNRTSRQLAVSQQKIVEYSEHLEELVNERTSELKAAQAKLIETAHIAGKAEVATGVLHNIGNAINSVNVRLKLSEEKIYKLNVERLAQAVDMLESNSGRLDRYIAEDPRGKNVFPYIKLALNNMAEQRAEALNDIQFLDNQVRHICEIVSLQQSYATGRGGLREEHRINDILMDAVNMQSDILQRDGIAVEADFSYAEPILLDRLQLIQVFVNLIKNAARSIVAQAPDLKVMQLSTRLAKNGEGTSPMVEVVINDNGVGFSPDLRNKIFTFGFSTKKDGGKGFGLHSCANYLQSIEGRIRAESDGPGKGARFIVHIPIERSEGTRYGKRKN
jgi:C4-dicarboxylate-specific signal transduction histidine kinase